MSDVQSAVEKVNEIIDKNRDETLKTLQDLVAIKSINPNFMDTPADSEEPQIQDMVEGIMHDLGFETERWEAVENRPNVIGRWQGTGAGKSLLFNGHIDVVPPGDESKWSYNPWGQVADGRLYGRGTGDMKAGVAAIIAAAQAIREAGIDLKGQLEWHSVVDEEAGALAGTRTVIDKGYLADAAIVAEPTDGIIYPAEGGLSWVRVIISGRASHAGWRYAQIYPQAEDGPFNVGVNAIEKGMKFLSALRELEREWALTKKHPLMPPGITTINPGVIHGGVGMGEDGLPAIRTNPAMIPDTCVIDFDFKFLPTQTFAEVRAEFEAWVDAFAKTDPWLKDNPPQIEWDLRNLNFPPMSTDPEHGLIKAIEASQSSLGMPSELAGFIAVTDAAFYAGADVPVVILGPTGGGYHGEDEWVDINSIMDSAKVFAGTAIRWCELA